MLILGGCWIVNAMNLYSLSLSLQVTFCCLWSSSLLESTPQEHTSSSHRQQLDLVQRQIIAGVAGLLGTVLATCYNILDHFLGFLFYLSVTFAPVAGVIVADHYHSLLIRRGNEWQRSNVEESALSSLPVLRHNRSRWAYRPETLLAWSMGILSSFLGLTGIAALDAFLASAMAHLFMVTTMSALLSNSQNLYHA